MSVESKAAALKNVGVGVVMIGGVVVVGYLGYQLYKLIKELIDSKEKFDPTSDKNLFYQGASKVWQELSGDPNATVGTGLYDVVDRVQDWLPWVESDRERQERLAREASDAIIRRRLETQPL